MPLSRIKALQELIFQFIKLCKACKINQIGAETMSQT